DPMLPEPAAAPSAPQAVTNTTMLIAASEAPSRDRIFTQGARRDKMPTSGLLSIPCRATKESLPQASSRSRQRSRGGLFCCAENAMAASRLTGISGLYLGNPPFWPGDFSYFSLKLNVSTRLRCSLGTGGW